MRCEISQRRSFLGGEEESACEIRFFASSVVKGVPMPMSHLDMR